MPLKKYQSGMEHASVLLIKIEDLVREILVQNNISYYRVDAGFDTSPETYNHPLIRIISYFDDTVSEISALLGNEFDLTTVERPAKKDNCWTNGFSSNSLQYVASLKNNRSDLTEYKRWGNKTFELQICSMMQDAWTGMGNELGFIGNATDEVKRNFNRIGALLEMANIEFQKIKQESGKQIRDNSVEEILTVGPGLTYDYIIPSPSANGNGIKPQQEVNSQPQTAPATNSHQAVEKPADKEALNTINAAQQNGNANGVQRPVETAHAPVAGIDTGMERNGHHAGIRAQQVADEYAAITEETLKTFVETNTLLKATDQKIAEKAGSKINQDVDIHGDVERLHFLKVFNIKQLQDTLAEHQKDVVLFAEKWIGKENGGSFDMGISLFYLEYVLVAKKNDPAFAVDYVLKFISDNDYSARYIIPTYNSIRLTDQANRFSHAAVK